MSLEERSTGGRWEDRQEGSCEERRGNERRGEERPMCFEMVGILEEET